MKTWLSSRRFAVVAVALLSLSGAPARALDPSRKVTQYMADVWQERSGLPQKFVKTLLQTRDGYIWVGTKGGLARFDGERFTTYDDLRPGQLKEAEVWALAEGRDGSLWIGTYGGGLSRFEHGRFTTHTVSEGLPNDFVTDLRVDRSGRLWIATMGGLARMDGDGRFTTFGVKDGLPGKGVLALHVDEGGTLWIGTDAGLAALRDDRIVDYAARHRGTLDLPVATIVGDGDGELWLGLSIGGGRGYGLRRLAGGRVTSFTTADGLPSDFVAALEIDEHGTLWVGTLGGLCRYRNGFERYYSEVSGAGARGALETASVNNVESLMADREGSLWIGTRFDGVARLRDTLFTTVAGEGSGLDVDIGGVAEGRGGVMWLSTGSGVIKRVEGESVQSYRMPDGLAAGALTEDGAGVLWIGTVNGLFMLRGGTVARVGLGEVDRLVISALQADGARAMWIGTRVGGLFHYDGVRLRHYGSREGLLGNQVRAVAVDANGGVWVGTRDGGVSLLREGRIVTFGPAQGLPGDTAQALRVDHEGSVWVATRRGLCRIRDGRVATVTAQHGLPANYFYQIVEDEQDNLWLTYGRGIARASRAELNAVADGRAETVSVAVFGAESGLRSTAMVVSSQPTAWRRTNGELWFATTRGVAVAAPRSMKRNEIPPRVHIEEIRLDAREAQAASDGLVLPPGEGGVEIRYTGLSYLAPDRVQFRYRLEPGDDAWVAAGTRRVAYYTNLRPRRYTFRVQACNADGVWSREDATLTFELAPHWYQTWWFYSLAGLVACGLAVAAYRWRVAELKRRQRELTLSVEEKTQHLELEIAGHRETEVKLQAAMGVREKAEEEARAFAEKLAKSNEELLQHQEQLQRENQERRRAEEEAGRERDLLHALMDNIPDGIYFKDLERRYTRVNRAHVEALGLADAAQVLGKRDADLVPGPHAAAVDDEERAILASGRASMGRSQRDARSGRWYLSTKVAFRDRSGCVRGLVAIAKDVSERKQAEEKLERELREFLDVVSAVARGDLTRRGTESDEVVGRIARSVNQMLDAFGGILTGARDTALSVSSSASEILAAARNIAEGARHGSDEVHSTSAAVEEMAASMNEVSRNAVLSADAAREVMDHLREGGAAVDATALGMARVDAAVSETAERMRALENRSRQIVEIVELMDELAAESRLLSLNAAIEAAHAGDAGRGFGVVAQEIRRLAERSNESTSQVRAIVEGIVDETRVVRSAMEHGMGEAHEGRRLSEQAQTNLVTVETLVERSARFSELIANAAKEQARATQTVSEAMQTIATVTQQSAGGAREATQAVQALVELSEQLSSSIARFRV